jgi:DNA polymerase-3 subunit alpha
MYSITDEYGGVGLLKFDFLGLTNLSVLADAVARVKERLGEIIDLDRIPLDDKKVFAMLTRGETLGVFQMAGSGMTTYLKELQPTVVHDLNAMVALYRPGPMAFIPEYIERKKNPTRVSYLDPRMESILKPTYGILIYQDDVMMIAVQLAGYSWGEADKFRKAMGKKIPEEMKKQKDHFVSGCIEHGMKPIVVQKLWEQIETFAAYGFNKAHAASYGNLSYKTAYMKANFQVDYMAAMLTADAGEVEKISEIVAECKYIGITVSPPSINASYGNFTVSNDTTISFGLYSIKNFGSGVADSIIKARDDGGAFTDIADFLTRVPDKNLNKKSLESLIKCGALDIINERGVLLANIELLLTYHREHQKAPTDQGALFAFAENTHASIRLVDSPPATLLQRLTWEKELLGLYVSGHPLDVHKEKLTKQKMTIKHGKSDFPRGIDTVIAGYIEDVRPILTKAGENMLFVRITDYSDTVEAVIFPRTLKETPDLFVLGTCVLLKGRFSDRNGNTSFIVEKVKEL